MLTTLTLDLRAMMCHLMVIRYYMAGHGNKLTSFDFGKRVLLWWQHERYTGGKVNTRGLTPAKVLETGKEE